MSLWKLNSEKFILIFFFLPIINNLFSFLVSYFHSFTARFTNWKTHTVFQFEGLKIKTKKKRIFFFEILLNRINSSPSIKIL